MIPPLKHPPVQRSLASLPLQNSSTRREQSSISIAQQLFFIEQIANFIMAGGAQDKDGNVGSPAPKQKGRATVDTLK